MISAAAALALLTLTQQDYCEPSIEPYISIEDDVVAMRRLDPRFVDRMPLADQFIAANTYYDEYLGFEGYFPWLNPEQLMPVTPPDHLARPREPGSDSAVEWESISILPSDYEVVWPPDPYIRPGARFCLARPFHFNSTPSPTSTPTPTPSPAPTPPPEIQATQTLPPANASAPALAQPPLYKLSGFVVLAFAIGILAGSALSNRLWWQWRNRRNRKNFQTLLDDLAQQEAHAAPVRPQRVNGVGSLPAQRIKKLASAQNHELRLEPATMNATQAFLIKSHAFYWSCLLCVVSTFLDLKGRLSQTVQITAQTALGVCARVRRRISSLANFKRLSGPSLVDAHVPAKRSLRCCAGAVNIYVRAQSDIEESFLPGPSSPRSRKLQRTVSVTLARCTPTSKGCQTTGVKRVCASVQTPQALANEDLPRRGGSLGGRGNHRTRRHTGNVQRPEVITDTSDLEEAQLVVSPSIAPSAPASPSTASTAVCNRGPCYDTSPPPGFEGGWHDHEEFLQTCQKLLDDMDNWDAPSSGFAATSTETASTLGENDTSQDIHSLLFALTGKMDEEIANLFQHNNGSRRCQSFN